MQTNAVYLGHRCAHPHLYNFPVYFFYLRIYLYKILAVHDEGVQA